MDIIFLLLFFLVVFGVSIRAAVIGDQDAERAEHDGQEGVHVGAGWIAGGSDGDVAP